MNTTEKKVGILLTIILIAAAMLAPATYAQTTGPVGEVPNLMTNQPNVDTLHQLEQAGKDGYNTLSKLSLKDGFKEDTFVLYHHGDIGGGIAVSTIATNSLNYGFAIAAIQETTTDALGVKHKSIDFYDGSFSVSYNGTASVPVLGSVDYYAETGAATDLKNPSAGIYNQSSAGLEKTWDINGNCYISVGGGALYLSKWNDTAYIGFISFTSHLHGKYLFGLI